MRSYVKNKEEKKGYQVFKEFQEAMVRPPQATEHTIMMFGRGIRTSDDHN